MKSSALIMSWIVTKLWPHSQSENGNDVVEFFFSFSKRKKKNQSNIWAAALWWIRFRSTDRFHADVKPDAHAVRSSACCLEGNLLCCSIIGDLALELIAWGFFFFLPSSLVLQACSWLRLHRHSTSFPWLISPYLVFLIRPHLILSRRTCLPLSIDVMNWQTERNGGKLAAGHELAATQ